MITKPQITELHFRHSVCIWSEGRTTEQEWGWEWEWERRPEPSPKPTTREALGVCQWVSVKFIIVNVLLKVGPESEAQGSPGPNK